MIKRPVVRIAVTAILAAIAGYLYWRNHRPEPVAGPPAVQVRTYQQKSGWGYDILRQGKVYIHQPYIPAIPGKRAFRDEAEAAKVGREVAARLERNQLPTITTEELKAWGIHTDSLSAQ